MAKKSKVAVMEPATVTVENVSEDASKGMIAPTSSQQEVAMFLEHRVAQRLLEDQTTHQARSKCKAPPAMVALAKEIMAQVVNNQRSIRILDPPPNKASFKQAQGRFHAIFGRNNFVYTVPHITDSEHTIDPNFHSLAGSQFINMDLELAFPDHDILCYSCNSKDLTRLRHNCSQNNKLFPIVTDSNEIWCRPFKYKCNDCCLEFNTNDDLFLASLPAFIRNQYPVDPRYAKNGAHSHLSKLLSRHVEENILTYNNVKKLMENIWRRKLEDYVDKTEDYFSRPNIGGDYPSLEDVVRTNPPADQTCRDLFLEAQDSTLNPERMSANDRHERIIQATTIEELMAIDWTFETLKNYRLVGDKAIFTVFNERGKICNLVIVPSEKLSEIDHMLKTMLRRRKINFNDGKRRALYTDTWPNSKDYWEKSLGPNTKGTLGLFHFGKRLTDHLNPKHSHFYMVKDQLQRCVYRYHKEDIENLMGAFRDGRITKQKQKNEPREPYSKQEIDELRLSSAWKRNYSQLLRKLILSGDEVDRNLHDFADGLEEYLKRVPNAEELFTSCLEAFKKQIENNRSHAYHIQDPEGIEMYRAQEPGKRSRYKLFRYFCKRPESWLEMFHGLMRHFANTAMRPEMADTLTLRGAAEYNLEREHTLEQMENGEAEFDCEFEDGPERLKKKPLFYNHAKLHHVNEMARRKGREPPFPKYKAMEPNNNEVFLSKYFKAQVQRNELGQTTEDGKYCSCVECRSYAVGLDAASASTALALESSVARPIKSPVAQRENESPDNKKAESVRNMTCVGSVQSLKCAHLLFI